MTEKYKIYLSEETRLRLINDAELFEFTKKDESVNLNAFLKTLIVNYFDRYRRDSEALLDNIMKDLTGLTSISNKAASALADKIISTYIKADNSKSGKNSALTLTVSGASYEILKIIELNMLKDTSLSQYLKDMFNSYLSIPRNERETIIFKDTYEDINKALEAHRVLTFASTYSERKYAFAVEPYMIAPSKEEQCNYLLCRDINTRTPRTFRISRMRNALFSSNFSTIQDVAEPHTINTKFFLVDPQEFQNHSNAFKNPELILSIHGSSSKKTTCFFFASKASR